MKNYLLLFVLFFSTFSYAQQLNRGLENTLKPHFHYTYVGTDGNIHCTENHHEVVENSKITANKNIVLTSVSPQVESNNQRKFTTTATQGATISLSDPNVTSGDTITAINYALQLWGTFVKSSVPIKVQFNWQTLGANVLGSAGSNNAVAIVNGSYRVVPMALRNAKTGTDNNGATVEIVANFNKAFTNWHFGTGSTTPAGKVSFVSTVLHEIGHGMGFAGSFRANSTTAPCTGIAGEGCIGFPLTNNLGQIVANATFDFDEYMVNSSSQNLTNATNFANPSTNLLSAVTTNNLYFNGTKAKTEYGLTLTTARRMNGPTLVPMHAPTTFAAGSTYSHFNESTFPSGNSNAMMTPVLVGNETTLTLGPVGCGLMSDLGYVLETGCSSLIQSPLPVNFTSFKASKSNKSIVLNWETSIEVNSQYFEIEKGYSEKVFEVIGKVNAKNNSVEFKKYIFNDQNPKEGIQYYRLKQVDIDGSIQYSKIISQDYSMDELVAFYPVPTVGRLYVKSEGGLKRIKIFDLNGKQLVNNETNGSEMDIAHLKTGTYIVELIENGKSTFQKIVKK